MHDSLPLLLDSSQVASLLNVRRQRVYGLNLPVVKIGPRTYRWHRDDILRLCSSGTSPEDRPTGGSLSTAVWAKPAHVERPWRKKRDELMSR